MYKYQIYRIILNFNICLIEFILVNQKYVNEVKLKEIRLIKREERVNFVIYMICKYVQ